MNNQINDLLARQRYIDQNMQQEKNPFDEGIQRAIRSAKESITMDKPQSDRAMRNSMLSFTNSLNEQPKVRGFANNLAQAGMALGPAIQTHDANEAAAMSSNQEMLKYAQQLRAAEEAAANKVEQTAYDREMDQRKFDQADSIARMGNKGGGRKSDDKIREHIIVKNIDAFGEFNAKNKAGKEKSRALNKMRDILTEEKNNNSWQTGTSLTAILNRFVRDNIGENHTEQSLNLLRMDLFDDLKNKFGARISDLDLRMFMKSIPSIAQPVDVSIEGLTNLIENADKDVEERTMRQNIVEGEFGNEASLYSKQVNDRLESLMREKNVKATFVDDDGNFYDIPDNEEEIAEVLRAHPHLKRVEGPSQEASSMEVL